MISSLHLATLALDREVQEKSTYSLILIINISLCKFEVKLMLITSGCEDVLVSKTSLKCTVATNVTFSCRLKYLFLHIFP